MIEVAREGEHPMKRLDYSELEYNEDGLYYHDRVPLAGVAFTVDRNEEVASEADFRDGLEWGVSRRWFHPGRPALVRETSRGVLHGQAKEWHPNGQLASEEQHELGICPRRRRWNKSGELVEDFTIRESDADYQTLQILREADRE